MINNTNPRCMAFLQSLVEQPLCYGLKSPDTDLYDFGFGQLVEVVSRHGIKKEICTYTLHATCRFKIINRISECGVEYYYEDSSSEEFNAHIRQLIGLFVKRVALSDKNDLWLDLGDYWIVFVTYENSEESWRFFISDEYHPHLVASNSWLEYPE